jgi:hypothetical protein
VAAQAEQRVHLVVKKTADPGGADAGGLGLEVRLVAKESASPLTTSWPHVG